MAVVPGDELTLRFLWVEVNGFETVDALWVCVTAATRSHELEAPTC